MAYVAQIFSRSRVVIGGDVFQTVVQHHGPEMVALTSPRDATGVFELDPQPDMNRPFENTGVDRSWEFRMPKAANLFDYRTIADVLITIEYTALHSFDYRQQVIQQLDRSISADRPFSFRSQFADAWYDLHNPEQPTGPLTVRHKTVREDFPPNIEDLAIQHLLLYFAPAAGRSLEVSTVDLAFTGEGEAGSIGGASAASVDGVISTRRGNASAWPAPSTKGPIGEWVLTLPEEMRDRFKNEEIEDILFVVTYSGRTPAWPA